MRRCPVFLLLLLFAAGCAKFDSRIERKQLDGDYQCYTLSNGYIGVTVMPQIGGMVSGIRYLPENRELFRKQEITVEKDDLLPPFPVISSTGITDYLWGVTTKGKIPARIRQLTETPDEVCITMSDRFFRMLDCEWTKKVTLKRGRSAFLVEMNFFNRSKKVLDIAVWQNILPALGRGRKSDIIVMPSKGQIRVVGRRKVKFFTEDTVFQERDSLDQEVFAAPARPWLSARNELFPGILVMRTSESLAGEGAFFYTYKNATIHTMEFIGKSISIRPGECTAVNIEYAFFPGMHNISEVFGREISTAVYAVLDGKKICMEWQCSGTSPAVEWEFFLTGINGGRFSLGKHFIPGLEVGRLFSIALPLPEEIPAGKYRLSGAGGGENFSIVQCFTVP